MNSPNRYAIFGQHRHAVRFDWGPVGARATEADLAVVVDVLSFSTSVCIAVERGMCVLPYRWKGPEAGDFARDNDAVLAVGRLESTLTDSPTPLSLSPAALVAAPSVPRLVLPSPNGSTITTILDEAGVQVVVGCLRNAGAVADVIAERLRLGDSVAVIAAGERWRDDDSLRPALEDQLGAGAVLAALARLGYREAMSPEATAAADLFDAVKSRLSQSIHGCVGARELEAMGFHTDVDVAAHWDVSRVVPTLVDGAFRLSAEHALTENPRE